MARLRIKAWNEHLWAEYMRAVLKMQARQPRGSSPPQGQMDALSQQWINALQWQACIAGVNAARAEEGRLELSLERQVQLSCELEGCMVSYIKVHLRLNTDVDAMKALDAAVAEKCGEYLTDPAPETGLPEEVLKAWADHIRDEIDSQGLKMIRALGMGDL